MQFYKCAQNLFLYLHIYATTRILSIEQNVVENIESLGSSDHNVGEFSAVTQINLRIRTWFSSG